MRILIRKLKCLSFFRKVKTDGAIPITACVRRYSYDQVNEAAASPAPAAAESPAAAAAESPAAAAAESPAAAAAAAEAPLVDLFGRRHDYLRISLTERCNLRCQYCMPAEGAALSPRWALLTRAELARAVRVFAALGVRKVRLTGGEPTLRPDLADIIQEVVEAGIEHVGMTTNGLVLTRRLPALQRAGLRALNVSLDSLRPERYERMARRQGLAKVLAGIDLALQLGYRPVKVNTVLMKGFNDDEICDFVEMTRDREIEVRFIEFMPFSGNSWDASRLVPYRQALRAAAARYELAPVGGGDVSDTARLWRADGHAGSVGFIASMTQPFCAACNRLRLTADGNIKVCLFGAAEVSVRDAMRSGADDHQLCALVRQALRNKRPQHAEPRSNGKPAHGAHWGVAGRRLGPGLRLGLRAYSTSEGEGAGEAGEAELTHVDGEGRARMVDVGDKPVTRRVAEAECWLEAGAGVLRLLAARRLAKGDALAAAELAGALAAKRAADLIPLCHPLPLECVRVRVTPPPAGLRGPGRVRVTCEVRCRARTGAEMEALTGCAVAALTLYDMCKAADRALVITGLRVVHKSGGRSGPWPPPPPPPAPPRAPTRPRDDAPLAETYVPTNLAYY